MLKKSFLCCGYPCLIMRTPMGWLCGYVGISELHRYFGKNLTKIRFDGDYPLVHGGVTYAKRKNPETGEKDGLWWLGFDCAHAGDSWPGAKQPGHEWTVDEVMEEIGHFAKQLAEAV